MLLLLLLLFWAILGIAAPASSPLVAAAAVEETPPTPATPRLPFPSVADAVGSAAASAIIRAQHELSERQLKHTSREHWLPRAGASLRAQGRVGDVVSVRALPPLPREGKGEEREQSDSSSSSSSSSSAASAFVVERFLIAHRGFGRCCNAWCVPKGTDPKVARRLGGISNCAGAPIAEAPVLLLARRTRRRTRTERQEEEEEQGNSGGDKAKGGGSGGEPASDFVVEREYLAGQLYMPHSVTLGPIPLEGANSSSPPEVFYAVDHLLDQVLTVSLSSGEEAGPRLGTPWSLDALRRSGGVGFGGGGDEGR